jgi:hypothetical protein
MPIWMLSAYTNELDHLAPFSVLCTMCHPTDRKKREELLGRIRSDTGGVSRRRPAGEEAVWEDIEEVAPRAGLAGSLLLTALQLDRFAPPATFNTAIGITQPWLPDWEQPVAPNWSPKSHYGHIPKARPHMLAAFEAFRSVAHLWAACLHAQQHQRADLWPDRLETLPAFLGVADFFLELGCRLPWYGTDRRWTLARNEAWRFAIPEGLRNRPSLEPLPLSPQQQQAFDDLKSRKPLI